MIWSKSVLAYLSTKRASAIIVFLRGSRTLLQAVPYSKLSDSFCQY